MTVQSVQAPPRGRTAVLVLAALVVVATATTLVSLAAIALGAEPDFGPLQPAAYLPYAIIGTLAALGGWVLVVRFVARSARLLRVVVPVLVGLSLIPDIALLVTGSIPGTTTVGVVALMLMHPLVAVAAVFTGRMIAPPR